jgi:hypothetical protein
VAKKSIAIYPSIAAGFWHLSKFICFLSTINSSSFTAFFGSTNLCKEAFCQMKIQQDAEAV